MAKPQLEEMYEGAPYSPLSVLVEPMSEDDTTCKVRETVIGVGAIPEAPNLLVFSHDVSGETIRYEQKVVEGDAITLSGITRGVAGIPQDWNAGTEVRRTFTATDHNAIVRNIRALGEADIGVDTADRALVSDENKNIVASSVTSAELGYLSGAESSIQQQITGHVTDDDIHVSEEDRDNWDNALELAQKNEEDIDALKETVTATQVWIPAVKTFVDLPSTVPSGNTPYLCRVIADSDATKNGVWQAIPNGTTTPNWTYFSDNADWIDEAELAEAIDEHNTDSTAHANLFVDATTSRKGVVQLSTDAENTAGSLTTKAVTPAGMKNYVDSKAPNITGGASTIVTSNLTASRALVSNSSGKVAVASTTSTELDYVAGVTSAIQTQINGKAATSHASTATTYGAADTSYYGHIRCATTAEHTSSTANIAVTPAGMRSYVSANAGASTLIVAGSSGGVVVRSGAASNYSSAGGDVFGADSSTSYSYSTALGPSATVSSANSIHLGGMAVTTLRAKPTSITALSDERDKTDFDVIESASEFLSKLEPIIYVDNNRRKYVDAEATLTEDERYLKDRGYVINYDKAAHAAGDKKGERRRVGFKAQQVRDLLGEVYGDINYANLYDDPKLDCVDEKELELAEQLGAEYELSIQYSNFVPFLVSAFQEQSAIIKELRGRIEALEGR